MTQWIKRWGAEIAATNSKGVWKLRSGGHLVRARATDSTTGKSIEIRRRLPEATEATAFHWLEQELLRARSGGKARRQTMPRFNAYATSLFEDKVALREIKSGKGIEKWRYTLEHLISGTADTIRVRVPVTADQPAGWKRALRDPQRFAHVRAFGEMYVDQIDSSDIDEWRVEIAKLITAGFYSPTTCNGWLAVLKVITSAAGRKYKIADPAAGARAFDTTEHETYTEEEPNALTAEQARAFLACMRVECPQHFAMTLLGFATGLRPSSLRPLRREGPDADIKWQEGKILVRQSHTIGIMQTTKTGIKQRVHVPEEVMDVLRWHVETQLITDKQRESKLLFPADDGGYRSSGVLVKPFAFVCAAIGLPFKFTPRGLRRSYTDLMRDAAVKDLVAMSISGHRTDKMRDLYSTVRPKEQVAAVGGLLRLIEGGAASSAHSDEHPSGDTSGDRASASGDRR
jgi:integrase